jgi:glutamyl/glutaminyl-tRNA synthetase
LDKIRRLFSFVFSTLAISTKNISLPLPNYTKTRIAPTPSGFLHLGNVLSFAITAAIAQESGAKILLRIDDLDQARVNKQYIQDIFDTLSFLQIPWHEGPRNVQDLEENYSQLHRMDNYHSALDKLKNDGLVFACTCSRQQINNGFACGCYEKKIPLSTENVSWRLLTDDAAEIAVKDHNGNITRTALPVEMKNFIVRKKDGFPAYQLTSVVDDIFYGIDLVVRGKDLWASTLAQHILADAIGKGNIFGQTAFYHHPLLMETHGKKLSKSAGATSIKYLRESGKSPADIFALIGDMAGIVEPVITWDQLAGAIIDQNN